MLSQILSRYWWATLLRGVAWVLFGLVVFAWPGMSVLTLTLLFGAFVLADGIGNIAAALGGRDESDTWWVLLLRGAVGICAALVTLISPGITAVTLLFLIAMWAIVTGFLEVVTAVELRKEIDGELWLGLGGLITIAFGVFLLARPEVGALAVVWVIAGYAMGFGAIKIVEAFEARALFRDVIRA
jgi:uncharacterized membrane protein HdeD (DUF308 family)